MEKQITHETLPKNVLKLRPLTALWYKSFHSSSSWWERAPPICQAYSFLNSIMLGSIFSPCNNWGTWEPGLPAKNLTVKIGRNKSHFIYFHLLDKIKITKIFFWSNISSSGNDITWKLHPRWNQRKKRSPSIFVRLEPNFGYFSSKSRELEEKKKQIVSR